MNEIVSKFQMENFIVRSFNAHNPLSMAQKYQVTFGFMPEVRYGIHMDNKKERYAVLSMNMKIIEGDDINFEANDDKLSVTICCQGSFKCPVKSLDEDKFLEMVKAAGSATMIPIIRARLMAACSLLGIPDSIHVPNIDVRKIDNWETNKVEF